MKEITVVKTHEDGTKTVYLGPLLLAVVLLNVLFAATAWICFRVWDFFL